MAREGRLHSGANLIGFDDIARDQLDGMLATYGFFVEMSKVDKGYAMRRFRNGHRYIMIEARTPKDESPLGQVKLGTGTTDWPDADWNHIPLWRLIRTKRPDQEAGDYMLDNLTLSSFLGT